MKTDKQFTQSSGMNFCDQCQDIKKLGKKGNIDIKELEIFNLHENT